MTGTSDVQAASSFTRGTNLLLTAACVVILVAGLQAAASLVVPVLVAVFLSLLCLQPMQKLQRMGVPPVPAVLLVLLTVAVAITGVIVLVNTSVGQFQEAIPTYQEKLRPMVVDAAGWLVESGVCTQETIDNVESLLNFEAILTLVGSATGEFLAALSNVFVVLLLMVFILAEATCIGPKIRNAFGKPESVLEDMAVIKDRVASYFSIKGAVSLLTGALVTALCLVLGVDFPVLWGFVAFLFNFVPNIGSIIAAVPAILIASIHPGPSQAGLLALGYLVINIVVGNFVEPRLMGKRLGLSTLVVFLSLIFWSWVWGPVGMLLSVPLTVMVKIVLEHIDEYRPIAVLLGP